jgi:probable rRNA maturation factor
MQLSIDVNILAGDWEATGLPLDELVNASVAAAIAHAEHPDDITGRDIELSVVLTDDKTVQTLNAEYRGKDKPTNVLSFATLEGDDPLPPEGPVHIGDIVLAFETLAREASDLQKPLRDHLTHLLVHGALHLLGYDHENDSDANIMESLEITVLETFSIENPYSETKFMQ